VDDDDRNELTTTGDRIVRHHEASQAAAVRALHDATYWHNMRLLEVPWYATLACLVARCLSDHIET
jgi:hypothetical protein